MENWGGLCSMPLEALRSGLKVAFYNLCKSNANVQTKDSRLSQLLNLAYLKYNV